MWKYIIAGLLRFNDHTFSLFYTVSNNFPNTEVIILMNKFTRIQICINGSRQRNFFILFCQKAFPETKGRPLALTGSRKSVHLRSNKSLKAFLMGSIVSGNRSTYDGST